MFEGADTAMYENGIHCLTRPVRSTPVRRNHGIEFTRQDEDALHSRKLDVPTQH